MSPPASVLILACWALCGPTAVSGGLGRPRNVSLTSYNMNLVLRWDPPEGPHGDLVYTTRLSSRSTSVEGCVNASSLECDFTRLNMVTSQYGKYRGGVRAQSGAETSDWEESNQIILDQDTVIGPPNVTLFSTGPMIEVSIKDPVFAISPLRDVYSSASYNITYWKDGQREKATSISDVQQNWVVLSDLEVWTKYCVQVWIKTWNPKPSESSGTVCATTSDGEPAPWVAAVVAFVVLAAAASLVVAAVVHRKRISDFLCPKDSLPQHLKQYLLAPPDSSMYLAMQSSQPPEEIYDQVSVTADNRTVEGGRPLVAEESNCSQEPNTTVEETGRRGPAAAVRFSSV